MSDNGSVPVEGPGLAAHIEQAQRTRSHVIAELRELHEAESAILDELTRQQHEARARRDSYKRALDNLGAPTARVEAIKPKPKPGARSTGPRQRYRPTDEALAEVVKALRESPEPLRHGEIDKLVSISQETLTRAIKALRDDGVVRIARKSGNARFYALMPDA